MKRIILSFLLFVGVLSYSQSPKTKTVTIEPSMSLQNYEHYKRLVLNSPDSEIEYLEGFEYEWGFRYTLKVKEIKLKSTLSDGTRYSYEFIEVVKKEEVIDTTIKLAIDPMRYYYELPEEEKEDNITLKALNDSTYRYFEDVDILVPEKFIAMMKEIKDGTKTRVGEFEIENGKLRLVKI